MPQAPSAVSPVPSDCPSNAIARTFFAMNTAFRSTLLAGALVFAAFGTAAHAADEDVVARVGSEEITERDLKAAAAEVGEQFARLPADQRKLAVLSALIDIKVLARQAEAEALQDDPEVAAQIDFLRERTLHNAYFARNGVANITEEELKARFEKEVAAMPATEEVHARHILLKTKEEAEAVIAKLDGGADFVELAKESSTGPSGPEGGDLGFFSAGQMVPEFEKVAFTMEPGTYTKEPVQTQFGWHVIKVEEKREAPKPEFDAVKDQVRQVVLREKYMGLVQKARDDLPVEYVDPAMKSQVEALEKSMDPAAAPAAPAEQ
ncbi:peptidyl-prolyl cis-trans isomerase [Aurantimonas manganoxydans SI85-9A1]|uniref:Parvulin-like PPIase n=2 Tax=Aurantimonas manganoxydans TaxID=651183 RepID=Q1YGD2_AURMS|nr:peptidyl-prolyl cis-trans isomerase [Aurantimonas manganoxydans SI85-9A1]